MGVKRQKNQLVLAFMAEAEGEARSEADGGTETRVAMREHESPATYEQLMEGVC